VAHVRQELALRLTRRFGRLASEPCLGRVAKCSLGGSLLEMELLQLRTHLDEARLQLPYLTGPYTPNLRLEIPLSDFARDAGDEGERPKEEAREHHWGPDGYYQHEQREDHQPDVERRGPRPDCFEAAVEGSILTLRHVIQSRENSLVDLAVERAGDDGDGSIATVAAK